MDEQLAITIQNSMWRNTHDEETTFLNAVESIEPPLSKETIRLLFQTYLPIDDFGTQEAVSSKLSCADINDYFCILREELPRLMDRAPEHADDIILRAILFQSCDMEKCLTEMGYEDFRKAITFIFDRLISELEVRDFLEKLGKFDDDARN